MQVCIWGRWKKRKVRHKIHYSGSLLCRGDWMWLGRNTVYVYISGDITLLKLDGVHVVVHFYYFSLNYQFFIIYSIFHSKNLIALNPRSKHPLISWLQSPSTMILGPKEIKSPTVSIVPQLFAVKWWDWMPWSSFSECWVLSQLFHSPLSPSSTGSLVPLRFLPQGWCHPHTPRGSWQPNGRQRGLSRPFRMEEALPGFCEEIHYVSLLH